MTHRPDLFTFYGDDFTGSTDAMLQYHRFGLRTILFLGTPDAAELVRCAESYDVIGIAGVTRSMHCNEIGAVIKPALRSLAALGPSLVQYKVCSTGDSSPDIGSFRPAVEIGRELTGWLPMPVLVAQPNLGRYTLFGNHFALDEGLVLRLDRQTAMANHPVTPMHESDLRVHIAAQVNGQVSGIDVLCLTNERAASNAYQRATDEGHEVVLFDALDYLHLRAGASVIMEAAGAKTAFAIGSGGLCVGIAARHTGIGPLPDDDPRPVAGSCLVVSGSCSPVTAAQIAWATSRGWMGIHLDPRSLAPGSEVAEEELQRVSEAAVRGLDSTPGAIVYTSLGVVDDISTRNRVDVATLGSALATVIRHCRRLSSVKRVVVAGGDTSGHVMLATGARSLEAVGPVGGVAIMCRVLTGPSDMKGLEVVLKGGQIGGNSFFEEVMGGRRRGLVHDVAR